jgi:hypothetical protein
MNIRQEVDEKHISSSPRIIKTLEDLDKKQLIDKVNHLENRQRMNEKMLEIYRTRLSFYKEMNKRLNKNQTSNDMQRSTRRLTNIKP